MEGLASCKEDDPVRRLWSANGLDHPAIDLGCWAGQAIVKKTVRNNNFTFIRAFSTWDFPRKAFLRWSGQPGASKVFYLSPLTPLFPSTPPPLLLNCKLRRTEIESLPLLLTNLSEEKLISSLRNSILRDFHFETQFSQLVLAEPAAGKPLKWSGIESSNLFVNKRPTIYPKFNPHIIYLDCLLQ